MIDIWDGPGMCKDLPGVVWGSALAWVLGEAGSLGGHQVNPRTVSARDRKPEPGRPL